ncbi:MAG: FtsW/RodA/SpoVE family cell cycle protein [Longimicrobiaceae bacterium]
MSRALAMPLAHAGGEDRWEGGALVAGVALLSGFGLVALYSASAFLAHSDGLPGHYYALRQLLGMAAGTVLAFALSRVDYRRLRRLAWPLLALSVILLVVLVLPWTEQLAPRVNGARRWLHLGVAFQPSEFAEWAALVWTAALTVKKRDRLHSLSKGLLPFLLVWGGLAGLIVLQPNLSSALLLLLLCATVLFAGGARVGHFIVLGMAAVPVIWGQIEAAAYRSQRIAAFLDPAADPVGSGYQIRQSLISVGSGGYFGVGFGESRQKFGFLPEPHNDFIFAMIAEEWGMAGSGLVLLLFGAIGWVGFRIAGRAPDLFGHLLAVGMTLLLVVPALLHVGVNLALLPATGVTLPFVSFGRSALLASFAAVGVLLSIHRNRAEEGVAA